VYSRMVKAALEPHALVNFVNTHDTPRFLALQRDTSLYSNALAFVTSIQGVPLFLYGDEQDLVGGDDPNDANLFRVPLWHKGYSTHSERYGLIRLLLRLRRKFFQCTYTALYEDDNVLVFARGEYVVVVNNLGMGSSNLPAQRVMTLSRKSGICDVSRYCDALDEGHCVEPQPYHHVKADEPGFSDSNYSGGGSYGYGELEQPACVLRVSIAEDAMPRVYRATHRPASTAAAQAERLEEAKPILWLHVPKTGTAMLRNMMGLPGVCPHMDSQWNGNEYDIIRDTREHLATMCPGGLAYDGQRFWFNHMGIGREFAQHSGRIMMMLRQPDQRLVSDYHNEGGAISWPGTSIHPEDSSVPPSMSTFVEGAAGCAVKMLTRSSADKTDVICASSPEKPSSDEIALAVQRLRSGVVFVGLTEQWDLSVCLLHKMFGGFCQPWEFHSERDPQHHRNLSELGSFRDVWDAPLYLEASNIFHANLHLYGVSEESCRSCWSVRG